MQLSINGQQLHRTITVVKQPDTDGGNAGQSTVTNPFCSINRTKTVTQNKGDDNDTQLVARAVLGAELKNIKLTISLDRWVDSNGNLFKPNTLISIINQDLLIFDKTNFFIESVNFVRNSNGKSCKSGIDSIYNHYINNPVCDVASLKDFFAYNDQLDRARGTKLIDFIPELEAARKYTSE